MPIGKYSANLGYSPAKTKENSRDGSNRPQTYGVPDGFEVLEGQTEYKVELGKTWKK